jgi:hypothetical protein
MKLVSFLIDFARIFKKRRKKGSLSIPASLLRLCDQRPNEKHDKSKCKATELHQSHVAIDFSLHNLIPPPKIMRKVSTGKEKFLVTMMI